MSESMHLKDITFFRSDIDEYGTGSVVWVDHDGERDLPAPDGRGDLATLLINVGVDGIYTVVHHQQGDRAVLEKVIADLQYLVTRLDAIYPQKDPRGRCVVFGDWGRCWGDSGHPEGEHRFPTEEDWNRSNPRKTISAGLAPE